MIDSPKSLCPCDSVTIKVTACPSNPECDHTMSVTEGQNAFLVHYYKQTFSVLLSPVFSIACNVWRIGRDTACIVPLFLVFQNCTSPCGYPTLPVSPTCRQTPECFTAWALHTELWRQPLACTPFFFQVSLPPGFRIPELHDQFAQPL